MLTTLALTYFPFQSSTPSRDPLLAAQRYAGSIPLVSDPSSSSDASSDASPEPSPVGLRRDDEPRPVGQFRELDYVAMDRSGPDYGDNEKYVLLAVWFKKLMC
jgi:hypothetical protein